MEFVNPRIQLKCELWGLKHDPVSISFLPATDMIHGLHYTTFTHGMMASKEAMDNKSS